MNNELDSFTQVFDQLTFIRSKMVILIRIALEEWVRSVFLNRGAAR